MTGTRCWGLQQRISARLRGGTAINRMPERCVAELALRLLPQHDADRVQQALTDMAGDGFTLDRIALTPAVETRVDDPFAMLCLAAVAEVTGLPHDAIGVNGLTDWAMPCPDLGVPVILIGPGQPGGPVPLADVVAASQINARIAKGWLWV